MCKTGPLFACAVLAASFLLTSAQKEAVVALTFSSCASYMYSINEGASQYLCAVLVYINGSATLVNDITVQFVPANNTAFYPFDFPYIKYNVTFVAGTAQGKTLCVNISTIDDTDVENSESFYVNLVAANPSQVTIGDRAGGLFATITLTDNDVATFTLDGNYTITEGAGSTQVCAVLYSGALAVSATLKFTATAITAIASDFSMSPTSTTIIAGAAVGTITCVTISAPKDSILENNETFSITIAALSRSAVIPSRSVSYVKIIDADVVVIGLFSGNAAQGLESAASVSFCVVITNTVTLSISVSVPVSTSDITATSGLDYLPPSPSSITILSMTGPNSPVCTNFQTLQDSVVENNENLTILLSSTTSQVQILSTAVSTTFLIIEDGDTVLIGFATTTINTTEGSNASICAQIKSGSLGISVSVIISTTLLGSATANADYLPISSASITFDPGSTVNSTSCYSLVIIDDNAVENDETISLSISGSTPVNIQQSTSFTVVTIRENNADSVSIGLGNSLKATEGLNLTASICATILQGSLQVSVSILAFTVNITATPTTDYESKSATLTFPSGKAVGDSVCFSIGIVNDLIVENPEVFSVNLQSIDPRAVVAAGRGQISITIYDDSADVITLGFQNPQYRTAETSSSASVCILMLSGQLGKDVPIAVTTSDQTAIGGKDYVRLNTTVLFSSGMVAGNSLCISIVVLDDDIVEASQESFNVSITDSDPAAIIESGVVPVNIDEDTNDVVLIGFQSATYTVNTAINSLTLCTTMYTGNTERLVSVYATTISKEATANVDYVGITSQALNFPAGSGPSSTACFNLVIINDNDIEQSETFNVILTQTDSAVQLSSQYATAVVTIPLNPSDRVTAKMSNSSISIAAMSSTSVCAELEFASGNLTYSVTATLGLNGTATEGTDYTMSQKIIVFPAYTAVGLASKQCVTLFSLTSSGSAKSVVITLISSTPVLTIDSTFVTMNVTIT